LRAILTNPSIIKIGHSIRQTLETIAEAFSLPEINKIVKAKNAPILELGKYAKLKGVVDDPTVSLHALAGAVLRNSFSIPHFSPYPWSNSTSSVQDEFLFKEVDCLWQISLSLHCRDSLGLPLQPAQAQTHGQLVTLVHGCKPVAEGSIVGHHPGYLDAVMDDEGHTKRINISASRSLIEISKVCEFDFSSCHLNQYIFKVLVPGALHSLHQNTVEWIAAHGAKAVVTTSQLHTRGDVPPIPSNSLARMYAVPAPLIPSPEEEDFSLTYTSSDSNVLEFEHWSEGMEAMEDDDNSSDDGSEPDEDHYGQFSFKVAPVHSFSFSIFFPVKSLYRIPIQWRILKKCVVLSLRR
jgi:hypothetical protein